MPRQSGEVTTDQTVVRTALDFGAIVLPPGAQVLGVRHDYAMDELYTLAIAMRPADVDQLLVGSNFTAPFEPDPGPFMQPIPGFDLTKATVVTSANDSVAPHGDRKETVFRRIVVDRSDPAKAVVHLWLFTT